MVGRDKTGEQRDEIKHDQNRAANHRNATALQSLPENLPRGKRDLLFSVWNWRGSFHFLFQTDARVAPSEQDVGDEISDDQQRRGHDDAVHDEIGIFREERLHRQPSEPGPRHDVLDDERAAQQRGERVAENRQQRIDGVAKRVLVDDLSLIHI